MKLRDDTVTSDRRLDRLVQFDPKSRNFPARALLSAAEQKKPRSFTWSCLAALDQLNEGACVGFSITHELIARPVKVQGLDAQFAREKIYYEAQRVDPWPGGEYPGASPRAGGTSVLEGIKAAHRLGYFAEYRWCFGLDDLQLSVGYTGPVVLGINWHEEMFRTDADGFIRVAGSVAGGHAILCNAVNVKLRRFNLHNSWGAQWGRGGDAWISFEDMDKLLRAHGEACVVVGRKMPVR